MLKILIQNFLKSVCIMLQHSYIILEDLLKTHNFKILDCSIRVVYVNTTALVERLTVLLEYINLLCVT